MDGVTKRNNNACVFAFHGGLGMSTPAKGVIAGEPEEIRKLFEDTLDTENGLQTGDMEGDFPVSLLMLPDVRQVVAISEGGKLRYLTEEHGLPESAMQFLMAFRREWGLKLTE